MDLIRRPCSLQGIRPMVVPLVLRLAQTVLNIIALIPISIMLYQLQISAIGKTLPIPSNNLFNTWVEAVWLSIMVIELILSASGILLYLLKTLCHCEESWKLVWGAYHVFQSLIILYGFLLGSQRLLFVFTWATGPTMGKHSEILSIIPAIFGAFICQVDSIVHFITAFFPCPYIMGSDSCKKPENPLPVPGIFVETPSFTTDSFVGSGVDSEGINSVSTLGSEPDNPNPL